MKCSLVVPLLFWAETLFAQRVTPTPRVEDAAAAAATTGACGVGCCGSVAFMIFVVAALFVLNLAMLIWVARDAKSRGMDNSVMWMVLVFFTSLLGLVIYIFSRPQG